jgi:hypothetical protein
LIEESGRENISRDELEKEKSLETGQGEESEEGMKDERQGAKSLTKEPTRRKRPKDGGA